MTLAAAPSSAPLGPTRAAAARAVIERQTAKLERLAEIGMAIAEAAGRTAQALADSAGADPQAADPGLTFSRAARAVRLTIMLQSRLAAERAALERGEAVVRAGEAARRRDLVHRRVEQRALGEGCDAEAVEHLAFEAWERLTDEDDADLLDRPFEEVVARICRDLGLAPNGARRGSGSLNRPLVVLRSRQDAIRSSQAKAAERQPQVWPPGTVLSGDPRPTRCSRPSPAPGRRQP